MKKLLSKFLIIFISATLWASPYTLHAQPDTPDDANPGDPDLPLDGGVALLIAAGVGYGVKKIRDERRKKRHA